MSDFVIFNAYIIRFIIFQNKFEIWENTLKFGKMENFGRKVFILKRVKRKIRIFATEIVNEKDSRAGFGNEQYRLGRGE